jgi:hypothetical protein
MSLQLEILADVLHRERMGTLSPTDERRRLAAQLLQSLRCCLQPSHTSRLLAALDGPATGCCITGG